MEYYYTIMCHVIGLPDYLDFDMSDCEEDCFTFDTEDEATEFLRQNLNDGKPINDERYGNCRYYVDRKKVSTRCWFDEPMQKEYSL
jgi:hypothetical protein